MLYGEYCAPQHSIYCITTIKKRSETPWNSWALELKGDASMARASIAVAHHPFSFSSLPAFSAPRSLWRMIRDALVEARQAQIEREIETYLAGTGGKLTDESERQIERFCIGGSLRW
jgi:hypothetical protein